jgi:hypothetical protein
MKKSRSSNFAAADSSNSWIASTDRISSTYRRRRQFQPTSFTRLLQAEHSKKKKKKRERFGRSGAIEKRLLVIHRNRRVLNSSIGSSGHQNLSRRARVCVLNGFRVRVKSSTESAAGCLCIQP